MRLSEELISAQAVVAQRLKAARESFGFSQSEVAVKAAVGLMNVRRLERGAAAHPVLLARVARVLGVDLNGLFEGV